jgi:uncharacterized damage-inducible protein DinB
MDLSQAPWKRYLSENEPNEPAVDLGQELCRKFIEHSERTRNFFAGISLAKIDYRYAPEKWSVKQVVGHLTDANLIFLYRLVCISRGESKSLPGFDENAYVENADFDQAKWENLLQIHQGIAAATIGIIKGLNPEAWTRLGSANAVDIRPVELIRVIIGHEKHHIQVLKERYGLT